MSDSLVQNQGDDLIGRIVHIDPILGGRDVDPCGQVQLSVVLGPCSILQGRSLKVDDQTSRGSVQELSIALISPEIDKLIQSDGT